MIHGQHPIVVHVYIRLHSARLSTTFNGPHLPSWNVFFFSHLFFVQYVFIFLSLLSFVFLISYSHPRKFSFFLYMRMTKKSFPIRWQWGIRPCFERSQRLMFYHCFVTPTTESNAQRERNLKGLLNTCQPDNAQRLRSAQRKCLQTLCFNQFSYDI